MSGNRPCLMLVIHGNSPCPALLVRALAWIPLARKPPALAFSPCLTLRLPMDFHQAQAARMPEIRSRFHRRAEGFRNSAYPCHRPQFLQRLRGVQGAVGHLVLQPADLKLPLVPMNEAMASTHPDFFIPSNPGKTVTLI